MILGSDANQDHYDDIARGGLSKPDSKATEQMVSDVCIWLAGASKKNFICLAAGTMLSKDAVAKGSSAIALQCTL